MLVLVLCALAAAFAATLGVSETNFPSSRTIAANTTYSQKIEYHYNLTFSIEVEGLTGDDTISAYVLSLNTGYENLWKELFTLSAEIPFATVSVPVSTRLIGDLPSYASFVMLNTTLAAGAEVTAALLFVDTPTTNITWLAYYPGFTPRASTHRLEGISETTPAYFNTLQPTNKLNFDYAIVSAEAPGVVGEACAGTATVYSCHDFLPPRYGLGEYPWACDSLGAISLPFSSTSTAGLTRTVGADAGAGAGAGTGEGADQSQWFVFMLDAGAACDSIKASMLTYSYMESHRPYRFVFDQSVVTQLMLDYTQFSDVLDIVYPGGNHLIFCQVPCLERDCSDVDAAGAPFYGPYGWGAGDMAVASYGVDDNSELTYLNPMTPVSMRGQEDVQCFNTHMSLSPWSLGDSGTDKKYVFYLASELTPPRGTTFGAFYCFTYFATYLPSSGNAVVLTYASADVSGEFCIECAADADAGVGDLARGRRGEGATACTQLFVPFPADGTRADAESVFLGTSYYLDECEAAPDQDLHNLCAHDDSAGALVGITPWTTTVGMWSVRVTVASSPVSVPMEFQARVADIVYFAPREGSTVTHRELSQLDKTAFLIPIDHESFGGVRLSGCGEAATGCVSATLIDTCFVEVADSSGTYNETIEMLDLQCEDKALTQCSLLGLGANADGGNVASTDILYSDLTVGDAELADGLLLHVFTALPYNPTVGTHTSVDLLDAAGEVIAPRLSDASLVLKHARAVDDETADVTLAFTAADAPLYPAAGARDLTYTLAYVSSGADTVQTPCFWASNALGTRDLGALAAGGSASVSANVERGQWAMTLIVTDSLTGSQAVYAPVLVEKYEVAYVMWLTLVALVVVLVAAFVILFVVLRRYSQKRNVIRRLNELASSSDSNFSFSTASSRRSTSPIASQN